MDIYPEVREYVRKAAAAEEKQEITKFIDLARVTLALAAENRAPGICTFLTSLFYFVCPYDYRILHFIVSSFGRYASEDDVIKHGKDLKTVDHGLLVVVATRGEGHLVKDEMPGAAAQRLPFHAFLLRNSDDVEQIVRKIVEAELSIFNVIIWQNFLRDVSWLTPNFSNSDHVSFAILAHVDKYPISVRSLPEEERQIIYHLMCAAPAMIREPGRWSVLVTINVEIYNSVLTDVKREILQMVLEIKEQRTADLTGAEREKREESLAQWKDEVANMVTGRPCFS
ncbi:unnamed protein product [Caenorhabditis nigoni]